MRKLAIKITWCLFFVALTIYAPIELSRLIVLTGVPWDEMFEMILFWVLYASALFLFVWLVFRRGLPGVSS